MAAEKKFVALALGAQSVTGAVFSRGKGDQLILEAHQSADLLADPAADGTQTEQVQGAIKELVKKLKLKGSSVRFAVSSQSVFTRFVTLPPLEVDKLEEIVGFEAKQQVPFPLEEAVWDFAQVGDPDDIELEVVLVAMKSAELDVINNAVRAQGLDTETVDLAPMALYNAFRYNYPDIDQPTVLIDIGARTTNLIYVEGHKVFVRSVPVGGRDITQAIATEFGISFQEAEERKIQDGFVALGGGFADDENPEIAAMSKVIRQASTRLHAEVVRTNNFYRANQGGTIPTIAFLCGSGAGLPYLNEFFKEKLKIQVEYFNALRNVQVAKKVDDSVAQKAHSLGELVGLGLRGLGDCPIEVDLVPRVIQRERDLTRRKPFFWMAGLCATAMIAASGLYFQNASSFAASQTQNLTNRVNELQGYADQIEEQQQRLQMIQQRSGPYSTAVKDRVYWITTLNEINDKLVEDKVWIVEMQPLSQKKKLINEPVGQDSIELATVEQAGEGEHMIDSLLIKGLWRENPKGSSVVNEFLNNLRASDNYYFDLVERDENNVPKEGANGGRLYKQTNSEIFPGLDTPGLVGINVGSDGRHHAYDFHMVIPLAEWRQIKFTK